jgi:uncharacterized LabA/DUF88 family protein
LQGAGQDDKFDPRNLALFVQNEKILGKRVAPVRTLYYDAIDESAPEEKTRQEDYLRCVQSLPDTHAVIGRIRQGKRGREQKGVDVQLAVDALEAAWSGTVEAIGLVTGDADFVPLANAVRRLGPHVIVLAFANSLADDLRASADRVIELPPPPADWVRPLKDH